MTRSYLYHASDLHITWGPTLTGIWPRARTPVKPPAWAPELFTTHEHTRLTAEAIVSHFVAKLAAGERDWHLVITGDVTDAGSTEELREARRLLAPIWDPRFLSVVPGNHDVASNFIASRARRWDLTEPRSFGARFEAFTDCFGPLMKSSRPFAGYEWPYVKILKPLGIALIGLDSTADTGGLSAEGLVGDQQLRDLKRILKTLRSTPAYKNLSIFVALHHCPTPVGSRFWDSVMGLADGDDLLELCYNRVDCVLHGHLHTWALDWNGTEGDLPVFQAPSPVLDEAEIPGVDYEAIPVAAIRLKNGEIRSKKAFDDEWVDLAPTIRTRHAAFRKRYARLFRRAVPCARCAGPVTPEMGYCPWCSEEVVTSGDASLECDKCTGPVMPGFEHCPWCGTPFEDGDGTYATPRMSLQCEACDSWLEPYHRFCPACGERRDEPSDIHPDACANSGCGWPVDPHVYLFCPWCGDPM